MNSILDHTLEKEFKEYSWGSASYKRKKNDKLDYWGSITKSLKNVWSLTWIFPHTSVLH